MGRVQRLPLTYDSRNSQASALKLILTLAPEWAGSENQVEFVRFTDGITNTLLKAVNRRPGLSKEIIDQEAILLRAYGNKTAILIDREREAANHELLMLYGLAPDLLARFDNGMLYRYIAGDVAQPKHLSEPAISRAVARRLAEWHATVPCLPHNTPQTNGKTNGYQKLDASNRSNDDLIANTAPGKPAPNVWTTMQKWTLALPTETEQQRDRQAMLQREITEMVSKLSQRPGLGTNGVRTIFTPNPSSDLLPPSLFLFFLASRRLMSRRERDREMERKTHRRKRKTHANVDDPVARLCPL